jgi:hypothetical protein
MMRPVVDRPKRSRSPAAAAIDRISRTGGEWFPEDRRSGRVRDVAARSMAGLGSIVCPLGPPDRQRPRANRPGRECHLGTVGRVTCMRSA